MSASPGAPKHWLGPIVLCAACGRERPCYHARSARPLCRSCYRRENIGRWNISPWTKPTAVCCTCGEQGPAWFARSDHPLCDRCYRKQAPRSERQAPVSATCSGCGREQPCRPTAEGKLLCATCSRGRYDRQWRAPVARCAVCAQDAPVLFAASQRPICVRCRRRELAAARETPYRPPVAVCSDCGRERPCYFARSQAPLCQTCRWRGWRPPTDRCTVCQRTRPCHHAGTQRAICRPCQATRRERHEPCLACGALRRVARRVHGQPECGSCAKHRMRARVECVACEGTLRPAATDPQRCERCAGEAVLQECRLCGAQESNYDQGRCPPCALAARLRDLRDTGQSHAIARLEPYLAALAASRSPWGLLRWMRRSAGYQTVLELAAGTLELSHEALDALDRGQSTTYLRAALVRYGVLSKRPEQAASFERAARRALARLPEGEDRAQLRAFATWQLHHHLLRRERRNQTTRSSARYDAARLRAAVELARWAHANDLALSDVRQHDLERWLPDAGSAAVRIGDFLAWAARGHIMAALTLPPHHPRQRTDQLPTDARIALVRQLLHDDTLDLRDRVAGCLVLLLAQPVSRVLMLTAEHIALDGQHVTIRLGPDPLELPEPLGHLLATLCDQRTRSNTCAIEDNPPWLFPGRRADAPLSEEHFRRRLSALGITTLPARTAALMTLALTLPPAILADLLGISESNAANWSALAGATWGHYAAHGSTRYPPAGQRPRTHRDGQAHRTDPPAGP